MDLKETMGMLGLALGACVSAAVVLGVLAVPPRWGPALALPGPLYLLWLVIFTPDKSRTDEIGLNGWFTLALLLLFGLALGLPRLLRYAGQQPVWMNLGAGLTTAVVLAYAVGVANDVAKRLIFDPVTGAYNEVAAGSVPYWIAGSVGNGVLFSAPLALLIVSVLAWRWRAG